jgi:hypothetical protein
MQHIEQGHSGPLQWCIQHECQFHFHPRRNEAFEGDIAAGGEKHIVHEGRVVRFRDLRCLLHGARGETDFPAPHVASIRHFQFHPFGLNGVPILDGHVPVFRREVPKLSPALARFVQAPSQQSNGLFG